MNTMFKIIAVLITALSLPACVHHYGYSGQYGNGGYYPGYGNYYPQRHSSNQPRPPAYGYWRNMRPNNPYYRNQGNNFYYQNNYYNRPQQPRPIPGYGYRPGNYDHGPRNWGDRGHDGDHDHHDRRSSWGNWQGRSGGSYGRPLVNTNPSRGSYAPGAVAPYSGNRPYQGSFGGHRH